MKKLLCGTMVGICFYYYLMYSVTENDVRVKYVGYVCVIVTITMQASPLAAVVRCVQYLPWLYQFELAVCYYKGLR